MEFKDYGIDATILVDGRSLWKVSEMGKDHSIMFTNLHGKGVIAVGPCVNDIDVTSKLLKVLFGVGNGI